MKVSALNPEYTVSITTKDRKYDVTNALVSLNLSEQEKQIATSASIGLYDVTVDGKKLSSIISPPDRVTILAYDGATKKEVFRGYIWEMTPKESLTDADLSIKCYDQLIYWQESEDSDFFSEGKSTKAIIQSIADKWGISISYEYESITHEKLVLRGYIADFITADVLDTVKKRTGLNYVIRSEEDKIIIKPVGWNEYIYKISKENNASELRRYLTMNGVTTQVVVLGTASDDEKTPVEATLSSGTDDYGTLQKTLSHSEDTTTEAAKEEAQNILNENGKPKWEYDIKAVDIPWIRKGDLVEIKTDSINGTFLVKSIDRELSNRGKIMTLTVIDK